MTVTLSTESFERIFLDEDTAIEAAINHIEASLSAGLIFAKAVVTEADRIIAEFTAEDYV